MSHPLVQNRLTQKTKFRLGTTIGISLISFVIGVLLIAWWAGGTLIAPRLMSAYGLPPDLTGRPVEFPSLSGATLRGWFLPGNPGKGVLLLMHGIRATRLQMLDRAYFLRRAGYGILLFDFQAHGESTGSQITFGGLEGKDAQSAHLFLRKIAPDEKVGVIGVSLGGAAAVLADPPLAVAAMALESVYSTLDQAIANRLVMRLGPWGNLLSPLFTLQIRPRLGFEANLLNPLAAIPKIIAPKLILSGREDRHTTKEETVRLYQAALPPKELWIIPKAGHIDLHAFSKEAYEARLLQFFDQHLTRREPPPP